MSIMAAMSRAPTRSAPRKQYRRTKIREWRKFRGMTIEELAAAAGMSAPGLSLLERGQSGYTQAGLERLSAALKTDPGSLLNRDPNSDSPIWAELEGATDAERQQIEAVIRALRKPNASH